MTLPDYFLTRPSPWDTTDAKAFESLYSEQVETGIGARIQYGLDVPKWQFLCWLTDTKDVVLHGSGSVTIDEFEPRQALDTSEFGGQRAVFAASDGLWALFFAVVDRDVATSLVNASFVVVDHEGETSYYYFSVNRDALTRGAFRRGIVYVLPRSRFTRQADDHSHGMHVKANQWASTGPVKPLASLDVTPGDFPFLDQVNGHDQPTVAARAAADPTNFPWRD